MLPWFSGQFGNPSSNHAFGREARQAVNQAREQVAQFIGAEPDEIIFTSGGTEANNLAILGMVSASGRAQIKIVTSTIEHQAVLNPCLHIKNSGGYVSLIPVNSHCLIDTASALALMQNDVLLASIMLANNDTGVVQPVQSLSDQARRFGIILHTDAVQAVGKIPVDVTQLSVDLLSFSGHKLHGPQGVGALYVRKGVPLAPCAFGGHQERGLRPGTENVAAIVGLGKACELATNRLSADSNHLDILRNYFENEMLKRIPSVSVNGIGAARLPNTSNLRFDGIDGDALAMRMDCLGCAVSTGAACSSSGKEPSHVLTAMGLTRAQARSSVRFSFGRNNSFEEINRAIDIVVQAVKQIQNNEGL